MSPAPKETVPRALASWAEVTPGAVALLSPGRDALTYRELARRVDRRAAELRARGLGRGDAIALLIPEGPELCLTLLAAMAAGIAAPLVWPSPAAEHQEVLSHPRIRAVVVSAGIPSPREATERALPIILMDEASSGRLAETSRDGQTRDDVGAGTEPEPDDIAVILRSSGTTGRPKLAPLLHCNLIATCRAVVEARCFTPEDRCLSLARTAYAQGLLALAIALYSGSSLIEVAAPDAAALPDWLRAYRPTYISTTPAVLRALAEDDAARSALRQAPLRYIHSSAGSLAPDEVDRLEAELGTPILNMYGMSEAGFIAGESFPERQRAPGSVGPVRCDVRILDEAGTPLARGEAGEIVIRGPRVFPGYLDDPEANAAAFLPDGWFRTGDVGLVDENGYLYLTGRRDELINRGGEMIAPREIDDALRGHPAVAEAASFGVPDAQLGEDIVVAVLLTPGASVTPRELRRWLLDRLSPSKVPRRIWFVDHVPRTATGKMRRGELARRWSAERG